MSKSPEEGMDLQTAAEQAWEQHAAEAGIDNEGDPLPEEAIEDDAPAIKAEDDPEVEVEETPEEAPTEPVEAATGEEAPEPDETPAEPDPGVYVAPAVWKQEWKDQFNKIESPEMRKAILEQNKLMNQAFTQKTMEIAEYRKEYDGIARSIQPHQERLQRAGITPETAVQRALAWDAHIQQNPEQGIRDYAKAYGIELGGQEQAQDQYLTPSERALKAQQDQYGQSIQQMQQQMQQWNQMQSEQEWNQRQANATNMLDEFMNAKDEAGNPKHPFIENVAGTMTQLVQSGFELESAYNMAVSNDPDIQSALAQKREADRVKAAKEKADKVRKASKSGIVGRPAGKPSEPTLGVEGEVERAYQQVINSR